MNDVVIFDIEASCEDRAINSRYNMETIEIGAVKVNRGKVIDKFQTFVKPEYIERLTPFCTELTGITFDDLEDAPAFNEAIIDFYGFIYGCEIYSCGEFDRKFLTREIDDKGDNYTHQLARNAINSSHTDLKKHFSNVTGRKKQGMIGMAKELDIELTGDEHRALADSENLTKIFFKIERIREEGLLEIFNDKTMDKLVKSINNNHGNRYIVEKVAESYTNYCKLTNELSHLSFLEFIDAWAQTMLTDTLERNLNYIGPREIKSLRKYAK